LNSPITKAFCLGGVRSCSEVIMGTKKSIDIIDKHLGLRLHRARTMRGLSLKQLAALTNITYQQIQKYERGANRLSASRLIELALRLNISLDWFFDGILTSQIPHADKYKNDIALHSDIEILYERETQELLCFYYSIGDPTLRNFLRSMIEGFAEKYTKH
jgi:transcriptional regulator with XRE-family HTH domain